MKTLKVTLKQHTPLIHFQHDQYGATLRASEVKPKLDRFILSHLVENDYKKGVLFAKTQGWLMGQGEFPALNYKIRIKAEKVDEYLLASYLNSNDKMVLDENNIKYIDQTPYFEQEKENKGIVRDICKWNEIRCKGVLYNNIEITINTFFHDSFLSEFSKMLQSFFLCENFGTRQGKGFGSFEVTGLRINNETCELLNNECILKNNFLFVYKKTIKNTSFKNVFKIISTDYKLLKSGVNSPYSKSKIMLYGLKNKQRWEKRFFKNNIDSIYSTGNVKYELLNTHRCGRDKGDDEDYFYLRALLGLANRYEFLLSNPPTRNAKLIINVNSVEVERFKSPVFFKVLEGCIYLLGNSIPDEILNKEFSFDVSVQKGEERKKDKEQKKDKIEETLFTPKSFDLKTFIEYAMSDKTNNAFLDYKKVDK